MFIHYKLSGRDGLPAKKVWLDHNTEVVFFADKDGIEDVRNKRLIEHLLEDPYHFEVCYKLYGVFFDENGIQVDEDLEAKKAAEAAEKQKRFEEYQKKQAAAKE